MKYTFDFENIQFDIQVKRKPIFIDLVEENVVPKQNMSFSEIENSNKGLANSNAVWYFGNPNGNSNIANPTGNLNIGNFGNPNPLGNFGNGNSAISWNSETLPFNKIESSKPLIEKEKFLFQEPFVFDGPEIVEDERFHYEAGLPFIANRFTYVGQYGIYRGYIHHWVRRGHLNKRSSYRKNSVNH